MSLLRLHTALDKQVSIGQNAPTLGEHWFLCVWDQIGDSGWRTYPATDYVDVHSDGSCDANTTSNYYGRLNAEMTWPNGDVTYGYNVSPIVEVLCAYQ